MGCGTPDRHPRAAVRHHRAAPRPDGADAGRCRRGWRWRPTRRWPAGAAAGRGELLRRQRDSGARADGRAVARRRLVCGGGGRRLRGGGGLRARRRPRPAPCWCPTPASSGSRSPLLWSTSPPIIVLRPHGRVSEHVADKLGARLRKRSAILIAQERTPGDWPRCEVRLTRPRARLGRARSGSRPPPRAGGSWSRRSGVRRRRGAVSCGSRPRTSPTSAPIATLPAVPVVEAASPMRVDGRLVPRLAGGRRAGRGRACRPTCRRRSSTPTSCRPATPRRALLGVRRGMRRRDAQARCPELGVLRRQPGPRRPGVRAGAGCGRGAAPRASPRCAPGWWRCVRRGASTAASRPRRRCSPSDWSGSASGTSGSALPTSCSPPSRPPGAPRAQDCLVVAPGESVPFLRELPVEVLDDCPERTPSACSSGSACAPSVTSATCRRPTSATGSAARSPGCTGWSAVTGAVAPRDPHPAARPGRATSTSSRRSTTPRRSASASGRPPTGSSTGWPGSGWSAPRCWSRRAAREASEPLRRRGPGCTRAGSPPPTWSTGCTGSCRESFRAGEVRAPVDRVLFEPMTVVPDAVHADALWGGTDERVERGIARVQGMLGHEAVVVRRAPGRSRPCRPAGPGAVGRAADRPAARRATLARQHPAARSGAGAEPSPWPAEVVGAGGRPVGVDDRGACQRRAAAVPARAACRLAAGRGLGRSVAGRGALVGGRRRDGSPASRSSVSTAAPG